MQLTFLGKNTTGNESPTLYATDRGTYVVQGWKVSDPQALAQMSVPDHETCLEIPRELVKFFPSEEAPRDRHGEADL